MFAALANGAYDEGDDRDEIGWNDVGSGGKTHKSYLYSKPGKFGETGSHLLMDI